MFLCCLPSGEEGPIEAGSREGGFETDRSEGPIEEGGVGGELIAVRGDSGSGQVNHTEVTGEGAVTDDDSSETSPSTRKASHVGDFPRHVPPISFPDTVSVQSERKECHELSQDNSSGFSLQTLDFSIRTSRRTR